MAALELHPSATASDPAHEAVRWGVWVSAIRCVLTYLVAPVVGGLAGFWGALGLGLQLAAAVAVIVGTRTLWRRRHRARVPYTAVAALVLATTGLAIGTTITGSVEAIR